MKFSPIALALSVVLASPAVAAPGDPRLLQGVLEWPPALTGGEPFIVMRGDDGRVYYADVMAAQRYVQATVSAGSRVALLGLESTKPHEIVAVALGSGDAAALSLALAQGTAATPPPPAATTSAAVVSKTADQDRQPRADRVSYYRWASAPLTSPESRRRSPRLLRIAATTRPNSAQTGVGRGREFLWV